ncbi:MAG TPA: hypothetical protein VEZ11_10620, partial [Thermoanaerobaculia bacterium]|nr:hypothetical protein [Thermoanaerobaculia bacterium]
DGTAHRYALDLPPGTVGSLALELECSEGPERAAMSAGVEFIVSARVVRGETERDYSIGDLLLVPLPKATA